MADHILIFQVEGNAVPKERARRGAAGHWYTPGKTRNWEELVGGRAKEALSGMTFGLAPKGIPVGVEVVFEISMPSFWRKSVKAEMVETICTQEPDLDNYVKALLDGMEEVVYHNDSQVGHLDARKEWALEGQTIVNVRW